MRPFLNHLSRRQPLRTPISCYHQHHHRRRLFASCHSLLNKNDSNISTNSGETPIPRAASLDSIKSNAPYHFYQTKILEEYVRRPANASTLRQYIFYGRQMTSDRLITAANWVRNELLTRLAHRIRDFQQLPFFVGMNPHIEFVYRLYWGAFEKLRKQPAIKTLDDNEDFCKCLEDLLDDGQLVVPKLALGITECARHYSGSQDLDRFMNRMLRSRISRRMLAEQHLALTEAHEHGWDMMGEGADGYVGIIFVRCSASDLVSQATRLVRRHAETIYAKPENSSRTPPAIRVNIHQDTQQGLQQVEDSKKIVFAYVPEHLEYILFELLSNAVRFTMAAWEKQPENPYPPVQLTVSANETDVYFRVTDQGKGIAPDVYKHLWSYQARAPSGQFHHFHQVQKMPSSISERATQAADLGQTHLGMGLTMSRILAEYWGGELQVMTMEGFGTDAYVRIPRLGTKAENLGFEDHPAVIPTAVQPNGGSGGRDNIFSENTSSHKKRRESSEQQEKHLIQQQPLNWYHPSVIQRNTPASKNNDGGDGWSKSCMVLE